MFNRGDRIKHTEYTRFFAVSLITLFEAIVMIFFFTRILLNLLVFGNKTRRNLFISSTTVRVKTDEGDVTRGVL